MQTVTKHLKKPMKKGILTIIIGILIIVIAYFGIEMFEFAKGVKEDVQKNGIELEQKPIVKLTEFKNGRWISTGDSLSGIEIKNGKWIQFYKIGEKESSVIYDFKTLNDYLTITNDSGTFEYYIIEYSNELLSLSYITIGRAPTHNYRLEK